MLQLRLWTIYGFVEEWVGLWDRAVAIEYLQRWRSAIAMLLYHRFDGGGVVIDCPFSFPISNPVLMSSTWMLMIVVEIRCWVSTSGALQVERFGQWWSSFLCLQSSMCGILCHYVIFGGGFRDMGRWVLWLSVHICLLALRLQHLLMGWFQYNLANSFVCECSCMSPCTPTAIVIDELKPSNTA